MSGTELRVRATLEDPLIDEVRRIRRELSERFDNDVRRLGEYVRQEGEELRRKYGLKAADLPLPTRTVAPQP